MKPYQGFLPGKARCPYCGKGADGWTETQARTFPRNGDVTICAYCAQVNLYEVNGGIFKVRKPTREELGQLFTEIPDLQKKVNLIKQFIIEEKKKKN
jgi:hypothetical protein